MQRVLRLRPSSRNCGASGPKVSLDRVSNCGEHLLTRKGPCSPCTDWPSRPHSPASIRLLHLGHILSEESVLGVAPPGQTVPPLSTPGTPEATGKSGASSGSALRKRFQNRSASTNSTSANNASGQGPLPTAPSYRNLRPGTSPTVMHVLVKPEDSQSPSAAAAADTKTSPAKGSGLRGRKGAKEEERKEEGGGESSSSAVAGGETGGATAGNTTPGATNAAAATAAAAGAAPGAAGVNEGGAASRGGAIEASNSRRQQSDADGSGGCCASCVIA